MKVLVTGSSGLVGSEAVRRYAAEGGDVVGIDNNMRRTFFGPAGDTLPNLERLKLDVPGFRHLDMDIRDREGLIGLFREERFDVVIHCAAQPSHDKAKEIPLVDFDVNAGGTINLLEATRLWCPEAVFACMSTNKVYGDAPNEIPLVELETRWEYARPEDHGGVREDCRIDRTLHSLFGASKTAADVVAQEYGRYFGLRVGVFRGGCLTGEGHAGVPLHGFLSYLFKAAQSGTKYTILGYKGKQVRDQLHATDVVSAFVEFGKDPRPGEVYNLGGGRENSASILECIAKLEACLGTRMITEYVDQPRTGDHACYISDLGKLRRDYPGWKVTVSLDQIIDRMASAS